MQLTAAGVCDRVEEIVVADARDLSRWPDQAFDAVLSLGRSTIYPIPPIGTAPPRSSYGCCALAVWRLSR